MNEMTLRNDLAQMKALRLLLDNMPLHNGDLDRDVALRELDSRIEITEAAIKLLAQPSDLTHPKNSR